MQQLKLDDMEFAAVIGLLLWNLDARHDSSISEATREEGRRHKEVIYNEMHDYYTNQGEKCGNYAHRLATITSIVHGIDVAKTTVSTCSNAGRGRNAE